MLPPSSSSPSSQAIPCRIRISARKAKVPAAVPTTEPRRILVTFSESSALASSISSRTSVEALSETSTTRSASERCSGAGGGSGGGIGGGFWTGSAMSLLLRRVLVVDAAEGDRRDPRGGDARQGTGGGQEAAPDETFNEVVLHSDQTFPLGKWAVNHLCAAPGAVAPSLCHRGLSPSQMVVTSRSRAWSKSLSEAGIVSKIQPESSCSTAP